MLADEVILRCRQFAAFSETASGLTRTFLSPPMVDCHRALSAWMRALGMHVSTDDIGNVRGVYPGTEGASRRLLIGSHIDTVPNAGAFDGVLGVMLALALVKGLDGQRLPFEIEVVAFSEEEGVRFRMPFLGSRALTGTLSQHDLGARDEAGITVRQAILDFGLDPDRLDEAKLDRDRTIGYLEFHIEQGPVLEQANRPIAVVEAIAGQSRLEVRFAGSANHAGTTPMTQRRDALAGAAEWVLLVESEARKTSGLVATVGRITATPNAGNVIAGEAVLSLDVRHRDDSARLAGVKRILDGAVGIAQRRNLDITWRELLDQSAVLMDADLIACAERAFTDAGQEPFRMTSGAGHDAMILAALVPAVMIFLRSPGGISHHPDEAALVEDVAAAIRAGLALLHEIAKRYN